MKKLQGLIRRFLAWYEVGNLRAELAHMQQNRAWASQRAPQCRRRLIELGEEISRDEANVDQWRRHNEVLCDFEVDGLAGQWKGKA